MKNWEDMVTAWEDDQSKPNPFEEAKNSTYILCVGENKVSSCISGYFCTSS